MTLHSSTPRARLRWGIWLSLSLLAALNVACVRSSNSPEPTAKKQSNNQFIDPNSPIHEPPTPPPVATNPLQEAKLFVDPNSLAMLNLNVLRKKDPAQAKIIERIAQEPQGIWMGEWNSNIQRAVEHYVGRATQAGAVPILIAYNVPHRDAAAGTVGECHSCGGLESKEAYQRWIRAFHAGIGDHRAVIILEPDALPGIDALPPELQEERFFLLQDAVKVLRQNAQAAVYIDAGNPAWVPAAEMAELLKRSGVEHASGFALNVSNYRTTEECQKYGHEVSELIGGKRFVIDTSRNGAGPYLEAKNETESWCNPPGRKIGAPPTTNTGDPLVDGYLWLKRPGESDGECSGGPRAGAWWPEIALQMAQ